MRWLRNEHPAPEPRLNFDAYGRNSGASNHRELSAALEREIAEASGSRIQAKYPDNFIALGTPLGGWDLLTTIISGILPTMLTLDEISSLVRQQLDHITDPALLNRMRERLVTSYPVEQDWDYWHVGERLTCWTVLEHPPSNTAIVCCEHGFGPSDSWGLVFLSGEHMGMAMDSGCFSTQESAMRQAWRGIVEIQRTTKSLEAGV